MRNIADAEDIGHFCYEPEAATRLAQKALTTTESVAFLSTPDLYQVVVAISPGAEIHATFKLASQEQGNTETKLYIFLDTLRVRSAAGQPSCCLQTSGYMHMITIKLTASVVLGPSSITSWPILPIPNPTLLWLLARCWHSRS